MRLKTETTCFVEAGGLYPLEPTAWRGQQRDIWNCRTDDTGAENNAPGATAGPASAIELAYGLLWRITLDMGSRHGFLVHQARQALLAQLDRAGQARGITAARQIEESRRKSRSGAAQTVKPLYYWNDPYRS